MSLGLKVIITNLLKTAVGYERSLFYFTSTAEKVYRAMGVYYLGYLFDTDLIDYISPENKEYIASFVGKFGSHEEEDLRRYFESENPDIQEEKKMIQSKVDEILSDKKKYKKKEKEDITSMGDLFDYFKSFPMTDEEKDNLKVQMEEFEKDVENLNRKSVRPFSKWIQRVTFYVDWKTVVDTLFSRQDVNFVLSHEGLEALSKQLDNPPGIMRVEFDPDATRHKSEPNGKRKVWITENTSRITGIKTYDKDFVPFAMGSAGLHYWKYAYSKGKKVPRNSKYFPQTEYIEIQNKLKSLINVIRMKLQG